MLAARRSGSPKRTQKGREDERTGRGRVAVNGIELRNHGFCRILPKVCACLKATSTTALLASCCLTTTPLSEVGAALNAKLRGHYQYFGVNDNWASLMVFRGAAKKLAFRWLNRRSPAPFEDVGRVLSLHGSLVRLPLRRS